MVRASKKIHVSKEYGAEPNLNIKHEKSFKNKGLTSILNKKEFNIEAVMYSDVIFPNCENEFRIKIDNSKFGQAIT